MKLANYLSQIWDTNNWVNSSQTVYEYDSNNNNTVLTYQNWNGTGWVNYLRYLYTYILIVTDVNDEELGVDQFDLFQNYPNPFNPSTTIRFSLPVQTQLKINTYNMLGELVKTISDNIFEPGFYNISFDASELSSGTYIYRLESDSFVETKKMILLK